MVVQGSRLMDRKVRKYPQLDGNSVVQKGGFYDKIVDCAKKAGLVQLSRSIVCMRGVSIRVMGYQGMNGDLGRNTQRKKGEQ